MERAVRRSARRPCQRARPRAGSAAWVGNQSIMTGRPAGHPERRIYFADGPPAARIRPGRTPRRPRGRRPRRGPRWLRAPRRGGGSRPPRGRCGSAGGRSPRGPRSPPRARRAASRSRTRSPPRTPRRRARGARSRCAAGSGSPGCRACAARWPASGWPPRRPAPRRCGMTCTWPVASPRIEKRSSRASMHATTASPSDGRLSRELGGWSLPWERRPSMTEVGRSPLTSTSAPPAPGSRWR
jgi:hypothetical protein